MSEEYYWPILLQIVTSSSPTVLESSTMIVLTAPSSIFIFWGLCFFLYSSMSYDPNGEKKEINACACVKQND